MRFSDRIGATKPPTVLHLESMPDELRASLWNQLLQLYDEHEHRPYWKMISTRLCRDIFKIPVDEIPYQEWDIRKWLKGLFMELKWHEVYNVMEYVAHNHQRSTIIIYEYGRSMRHPVSDSQVVASINHILEREYSGYRFLGNTLAPIADQCEIEEVNAATQIRGEVFNGAREHINAALELFGKRPSPDYRNAVKEAISAIESIAKQLGSKGGDGLTPALRALTEKAGLHGALRSAFEKMYGYSSDGSGIRHAILDEPTVDFEEAKFMIVACSAFANYMAGKAQKAGLLPASS